MSYDFEFEPEELQDSMAPLKVKTSDGERQTSVDATELLKILPGAFGNVQKW